MTTTKMKMLTAMMYLTPYEHATEDDLKTIEEIFADDDDRRAAGCPAFARTDRFDRRSRR